MTVQVCYCTASFLKTRIIKPQATGNASLWHLSPTLSFCTQDWLFGEQPAEVVVNYCEAKDKFMADWSPQTSPEVEAMAREEENKVIDRDFMKSPAIWIISTEPRGAKTGPRVVFGKRTWTHQRLAVVTDLLYVIWMYKYLDGWWR